VDRSTGQGGKLKIPRIKYPQKIDLKIPMSIPK
jgi:hypothetical protein